jgi:hypothetical protein
MANSLSLQTYNDLEMTRKPLFVDAARCAMIAWTTDYLERRI